MIAVKFVDDYNQLIDLYAKIMRTRLQFDQAEMPLHDDNHDGDQGLLSLSAV